MKPLPIILRADSDLPLAAQLRQQITWLIATQAVQPGEKLPSIRELGNQVGVHFHTVRAVYKQLALDGLITIRQGSGACVLPFSGLQLARHITGMRTNTIGVLIAGLDPFYLPFLRGIEGVANSMQFLTMICNTEDNPVKAKIQINQLIAHGVDGIIAASVGNLVEEAFGSGEPEPLLPVVYCDQPDLEGHSILFDAENAGYLATKHLLEHGHKRIGLVSAPVDWPNMSEYFIGYRRALAEQGLHPNPAWMGITNDFSITQGEVAANRLLARPDRPTAIIATADILAFGVLRAAKELGMRVPQDLAVIGYTDIELAALVEPPLTSVAAPVQEMGRLAMEILARLIKGENVTPMTQRLETRLIIRKSCGC